MTSFNLFDLPLKGTHLIEAGAGTGKTYTLTALFLRLVVEQGISIEQILVVTYTKAATEELKTRIRQRLLTTKKECLQDKPDDPFLEEIRQRKIPSNIILQRLQDALANFDRAAIYTIHGFCQRLLQYYAFETGHLFQSELVQDDAAFVQETTEDFWRRYISCAPKELVSEALNKLRGPEQLANLLQFCRFPNIVLWPEIKKPPLSAIRPWREVAQKICDEWADVQEEVIALLQYDGLNARMYGTCKKKDEKQALTPRQKKIAELCMAMDHWSGDYPLFNKFELFSSHKIELATNKGKTTPEHPFFDLCKIALERHDQLKKQLDAYLRYLKVRLLHTSRPEMTLKKTRHNVIFFDDLLLLVHRAVTGRNGHTLVKAIRSQYRMALVDEFQDTDQLQYEIFFKLFANSQNLLTMIGDPKQAIYSFRGADLFSYLHAASAAQSRSTLTKNWRATKELIRSLNTLFENHNRPFGFEQIKYKRAVASQTAPSKSLPAMRLWYLPADDQEMPPGGISATDAVFQIARAVAQEIVRLLNSRDNDVAPEQIAILVRTHHQAQIVKNALAERNIPAVLHSAGRIFDTPQAEELERVLAAVVSPSDPVLVRTALAGSLFGWDASTLKDCLEQESQRWHSQWERFWTYHRMWAQHGFFAMFRHMMTREGIKKRVLGYPDGERCMTNWLHLAELLHQAEMTHGFGPEGLIKWLAFKRRKDQVGSDEQQLRLESDALAVRIITMHKSKGLQFEVVFCPYTWTGIRDNQQAALLHDPQNGHRLTLAAGPSIPESFAHQARKEALTENLRMLYVALTRARQCCYWVWGRIKGAEVSAPAYLLHGHDIDLEVKGWEKQLKEKIIALNHAQWVQTLNGLVSRSEGNIDVTPIPSPDRRVHIVSDVQTGPLAARSPARDFDRHWRIASFSSLTAGGSTHSDEQSQSQADDSHRVVEKQKAPKVGHTLFEFPKGARAGLFFHDLLEHWDHTEQNKKVNHDLVCEKLRLHGYDSVWEDVASQLLSTLSHTPLMAEKDRFSLNQIAFGSRINEMAFYFPLKMVSSNQIQKVFQQYTGRSVRQDAADAMGRLNFAPVQGFMKGFIDMVFSHGGRYYLLDWKSNYLGATYGDYTPACLDKAMTESYYFLQYHLYAVALDQLLRRRLKDYANKDHFGGVFYIFLRGLAPESDGSSGVYYDRPDPKLMSALNQLLIANT